jgi:hypothetical protein
LREPIKFTGEDLHDSPLVGMAPLIRVADGGMRADAEHTRRYVLRSRLALLARSRKHATIAEASLLSTAP